MGVHSGGLTHTSMHSGPRYQWHLHAAAPLTLCLPPDCPHVHTAHKNVLQPELLGEGAGIALELLRSLQHARVSVLTCVCRWCGRVGGGLGQQVGPAAGLGGVWGQGQAL